MATTIYEKAKIELVFWKDRKADDGRSIYRLAPYCFVEVALGKNFVMPTPPNGTIIFSHDPNCGLRWDEYNDIVGMHIYEQRFGLPTQNPVQFFGTV